MFTSNYHTHTKRCGHAIGEDEDYVLSAVSHGIRNLGFSDHIMLPGYSEPKIRGDFTLYDDYLTSINSLKEKYKGHTNIYLGFEAEAFECYFPFYKEIVTNHVIDYLILGNHSAMNDGHEVYCWFSSITSASQLYLYKDLAISAMSTGLFKIFAHPDYFMTSIDNFDSDCRKVSKELIECAIAKGVYLEVNLAGIRKGRKKSTGQYPYPREEFFSLVSRYKAKCVFGMDAHAPEQLCDDVAEYTAAQFAKSHDLVMVDKIDSILQN